MTKLLGTGIINTAIKGELAKGKIVDYVTQLMATLNRQTAEIMRPFPVHACTDITGFGLLGHMAEMIYDLEMGIEVFAKRISIIPEALEFASMGFVPGGTYKNREFRAAMADFAPSVDKIFQDILFAPHTSGGLLICVSRENAQELLAQLQENLPTPVGLIGQVVAEPKGRIIFH